MFHVTAGPAGVDRGDARDEVGGLTLAPTATARASILAESSHRIERIEL